MKEQFVKPKLEVFQLEDDIILTSDCSDDCTDDIQCVTQGCGSQ